MGCDGAKKDAQVLGGWKGTMKLLCDDGGARIEIARRDSGQLAIDRGLFYNNI